MGGSEKGSSVEDYVGPGAAARLLVGALRLDPGTYRRVSLEPRAMRLCLLIVLVGGLAHGFGLLVRLGVAKGLLLGVELSFLRLGVVSAVVWVIGAGLLRRGASFGGIVRPLALAAAPTWLLVLVPLAAPSAGTLPGQGSLGLLVEGLIALWVFVASVVATRAALGGGWLAAIAISLVAREAALLLIFGSGGALHPGVAGG